MIRPVFRSVYVCLNGCVLCLKSHSAVLFISLGRGAVHISSLNPPCVLIVSANFGLFRQVRCKCSWADLHFLRKKNGERGNCLFYISCVTLGCVCTTHRLFFLFFLFTFVFWKTLMASLLPVIPSLGCAYPREQCGFAWVHIFQPNLKKHKNCSLIKI